MKNSIYTFLLLVVLAGLGACTASSESTSSAIFNDQEAFNKEAAALVKADEIYAMDNTKNEAGKSTTEVVITVLNAKDAPSGMMAKNELSRKLAEVAHKNMKDPKKVSSYKVEFQNKKGSLTESEYYTIQADGLE